MLSKLGISKDLGLAAFILRVGLGLVFVIGGVNKLSQLLDPDREAAIIKSYWSTSGYVNQFFIDFMFGPNGFSEWWFLTSLSFFELVSGLLFITGLFIRPLSLIYAFLLWTFVIALPVVTTPGLDVAVKTYMAPAILVQVRDIGLSGLMFVLFNLGSGRFSLDNRWNKAPSFLPQANWHNLGLLTRLSVALPLLVAGVFGGMANIPTFATTMIILLPLAFVLIGGKGLRYAGLVVVAVMLWYMLHKFNIDKSLIANLNGFKREFAFLAAGLLLAFFEGGNLFTLDDIKQWIKPRNKLLAANNLSDSVN